MADRKTVMGNTGGISHYYALTYSRKDIHISFAEEQVAVLDRTSVAQWPLRYCHA